MDILKWQDKENIPKRSLWIRFSAREIALNGPNPLSANIVWMNDYFYNRKVQFPDWDNKRNLSVTVTVVKVEEYFSEIIKYDVLDSNLKSTSTTSYVNVKNKHSISSISANY